MFSGEYLLHKLAAHKWLVKAGISAVVAADTLRSCYVVSQIAQERMKEMEQEEQAEMAAATVAMFRSVATRCAAKDADFWPPAVSRAAGVAVPPAAAASPADAPQLSILDQLLRPAAFDEPEAAAAVEAEQGDAFQAAVDAAAAAAAHDAPAPAPAASPASPTVVYITLDFVMRHTLRTMQQAVAMAATTLGAASEELPAVQEAREYRRWAEDAAAERVDAAREWCRARVAWPALACQRRSALRWRLALEGVTFPVRAGPGVARVETNLSGL